MPFRYIEKADCAIEIFNEPELGQEIIMKWAKEHPVKTNEDKFEEVFGCKPNKNTCPVYCQLGSSCRNCVNDDFWKQEYKEPGK